MSYTYNTKPNKMRGHQGPPMATKHTFLLGVRCGLCPSSRLHRPSVIGENIATKFRRYNKSRLQAEDKERLRQESKVQQEHVRQMVQTTQKKAPLMTRIKNFLQRPVW